MKLSQLLWLIQLAPTSGRSIGVQEGNVRGARADGGERDLRKDTRIIGGGPSEYGEYPYAVSLIKPIQRNHFCGGSLIARDVVLSAAHCGGGRYRVVIGQHKRTSYSDVEVISVKEEVPHPSYQKPGTDNDFTLIFLSRRASPEAATVRLNPVAAVPDDGDRVTVVGWGDTIADARYTQLSDTLKEVELTAVTNRDCARARGRVGTSNAYATYRGAITENMLCARGPAADSCKGDSGGPLVAKGRGGDPDVQVGVVSWGAGCADENFPGVYARVSSAYEWIRAEVCEKSLDPPPSFRCPTPDQENDYYDAIEASDTGSGIDTGFSGETTGNEPEGGGGFFGSFTSWTCSVFSVFC